MTMFAYKNKATFESGIANDLLNALENDKYLIFYHFDAETENIVYEALMRPEYFYDYLKLPKYVSFLLPPNGEATENNKYVDYGDYDYSHREYALTFAHFIALQEQSIITSEQFLEKYKDIEEEIKPLISLSSSEMKNRASTRKDFLELVNSLSSSALSLQEKVIAHLTPIIVFDRYYKNARIDLRINLKDQRSYKVSSINKLCDAVNNESTISYGKECAFKHCLSSFDKESQFLIDLLNSRFNRFSYYRDNDIDYKSVEAIINAYRGDSLFLFYTLDSRGYYHGDKIDEYKINEDEVVADISIDENGKLVVNPSINKDVDIFELKRKYLFINKVNKEVTLVSFSNDITKKIFDYLREHPSINYDYIKDIFMEKLIPLVQDNLKVDKKFQEEHQDIVFKINYYVDINDDDALEVKTLFYKGKEEISASNVSENKAYEFKYHSFATLLNSLKLVENGLIEDEDVILALLTMHIETLSKFADVYISDKLKAIQVKKVGKIAIKSKFDVDLIDVSLISEEYSDEEIRKILSAYKKKRKFIRIRDNIVTLDDDTVSSLSAFSEEFDLDEKEEAKVPLHELFKLSSYSDKLDVSYDDRIKDILDDIKNYDKSSYEVEDKYKDVLRPYQLSAFKWLSSLKKYHLSGILADDMGLGKTLEMIAFISSFKENEPILIVTPKNVLYNWENEFKTWDDSEEVKIILGSRVERHSIIKRIKKNEKVVYITSYDALRIDVEQYKDAHFSLMVLDEAQYIKNVSALKTKAVKAIDSEFRFALTGTPIENSLVDLWSIFDFLMPNYLSGFHGFESEYVNLVMANDEVATKRLKAKIKPFILRRVKEDVLKELPLKTETIFTSDMVPSQRELYNVELAKIKNSLDEKGKLQILSSLTRLRELCIDPSMLYENFEEQSGKISSVLDLLNEALLGGHKVLVFSAFTKSLEHLKEILDEENVASYYIYGGTSAKERVDIAKSFNKNDDVKIVLISLKAGGVGLNLVGADIVIHLDPWWNIAAENQASDRAHRIGQTRPVTIIKMVTKDSIEEKVLNLQKKKAELVNAVISSKDSGVSSLSDEDISYLLS